MNEWCILYSALCIVVHPKCFKIIRGGGGGGLSWTTTSVQHPLGWCDGCHRTTAPVRSPHTSYRWRGERVIEPIKCMRSPHTSYRWRGERVIEPIKCMRSPHTSYRWRGESHRANRSGYILANRLPTTSSNRQSKLWYTPITNTRWVTRKAQCYFLFSQHGTIERHKARGFRSKRRGTS